MVVTFETTQTLLTLFNQLCLQMQNSLDFYNNLIKSIIIRLSLTKPRLCFGVNKGILEFLA